ncbi:MAG TPA: response regulator [Blastocatellia bacterium]|nr:response regulator [Blastocatellia bacterium]
MSETILVVDDEEAILFAIREYFNAHGYEVDCARELEEAEALLGFIQYAAVIADLRLTGINGAEGLELVSYVRERCQATNIIILTAYGCPEVEGEALKRGVDVFLHKPKPLPELAQIVFGLLKQKSKQKRNT